MSPEWTPSLSRIFLGRVVWPLLVKLAGHRITIILSLLPYGKGGHGSLARLVLSRRGIEAEDPSPDFINGCPRAGEHFARLFGGRFNGVAGIAKHPGVFAQVHDAVHKLFQTGIELCCLVAQPAKVMCFGKWHIGPDEKGLERLLDRLLAVENGIFGRGRLCCQVDSGISQIVRRFA